MPFIRSIISKRRARIVAVILLFSKIISFYSCYIDKELIHIIITVFFNYRPSSYIKYIKLNMRSSYNI